MKPAILNFNKDKEKIEKLKIDPYVKVVDFIDSQVRELSKVKNIDAENLNTVWIYYSWSKTLAHTLNKEDYRLVRLSRNRNLITEEEQKKFSRRTIGITGLNVGNPGAICIVLGGGAEKMKFADNDVLELSNLNRFRASLGDLGINKAVLSARQAYEEDPFIDIEIFDKGISEENIDEFLTKPRVDLLIEEMDNMPLKIKIRERAKYFKIQVLMVTGNGSGLIVDIERFDINPDLPILNGCLKKDVAGKILSLNADTPARDRIMLARDFMGAEFLAERLRESFNLVGKELAGIQQLSEASFLRGAVLCYFAKQVLIGKPAPSGRYFLDLDSIV